MKTVFVLLGFGLLVASQVAAADTWVNGYTRKDGTYVPGHFRTDPNGTKLDNYSTHGNTNPYTGRPGTVDPYATPKARKYNSETGRYEDAH